MAVLFPKKTKYKSNQKNFYKFKGIENKYIFPKHNFICIKTKKNGRIKNTQLESCRKNLRKVMKRTDKLRIASFPDMPISKKNIGARMGKGKGNFYLYIANVKKGRIIFELNSKNFQFFNLKNKFRSAFRRINLDLFVLNLNEKRN